MTQLTPVSRGIITDIQGRILLVKHKLTKPWTLPGGHVEQGETFQAALIREIEEEFGITIQLHGNIVSAQESYVTPLVLPIVVRTIVFTNDCGEQHNYEEYFLAKTLSDIKAIQTSEIASYDWKTLEEIKNISPGEIYEGIREIILQKFDL